jgi:tRNA-intron endonuclease
VFLPVGDPYRDMDVTFDGQRLRAGTEARERFYDSRGYGQPQGGALELAPVEAAHLLFRGDIEHVRDRREGHQEPLGFEGLLASPALSEGSFFVYKDLRDRGFYLSPTVGSADAVEGRSTQRSAGEGSGEDAAGDFVVYPRGDGPWDDTVAYRVRAVSEREDVPARALRALVERAADEGATAVLAVVDEESEVTYIELAEPAIEGATDSAFPPVRGALLSDRVLVADPPDALYEQAFYGQQLDPEGHVQLSLVEAAHLADGGRLTLDGTESEHVDRLRDRGRAVEGARFDRRLQTYSALRDAGIVPKTGFKFGADFRTYAEVESVETLGHSELLVRVLPEGHAFAPRDLALDVRLAHGVRKRMVFALAGEGLSWLVAERLTP